MGLGQPSPLWSLERHMFLIRPEAHSPDTVGASYPGFPDTLKRLSAELEEKEPQLLCWG